MHFNQKMLDYRNELVLKKTFLVWKRCAIYMVTELPMRSFGSKEQITNLYAR